MLSCNFNGLKYSVGKTAYLDCRPSVVVKQFRPVIFVIALLALGACAVPTNQAADKSTGFLKELPEGVASIAAPYQNLREVILKPEDGCYWYRHVGPVETTMLPLRTAEGRPICTQVAVIPPATG